MRSVPLACAPEVRTASAPKDCDAETTRSSSLATTTGPTPLATARSWTRTIIGFPPMSASGLPGSRTDAYRAGMTTMQLMS